MSQETKESFDRLLDQLRARRVSDSVLHEYEDLWNRTDRLYDPRLIEKCQQDIIEVLEEVKKENMEHYRDISMENLDKARNVAKGYGDEFNKNYNSIFQGMPPEATYADRADVAQVIETEYGKVAISREEGKILANSGLTSEEKRQVLLGHVTEEEKERFAELTRRAMSMGMTEQQVKDFGDSFAKTAMLDDAEKAHELRKNMLENIETMNKQSKYEQDWEALCEENRDELYLKKAEDVQTWFNKQDVSQGMSMVSIQENIEQINQHTASIQQSFQNTEISQIDMKHQMGLAEIGALEVWINREALGIIPGLNREQMEKEAREACAALEQMKRSAIENRQEVTLILSDGTDITASYHEDSRGIRSADLRMNGEKMSAEEITEALNKKTEKEYSKELLKSGKQPGQSRASYESRNKEVSNIFGQATKAFEHGAEVINRAADYDDRR